MKSLIGVLVSSVLVVSFSTADDNEIFVLKANELSSYHRDLAKALLDSSTITREEYVTGAIGGDTPLAESDDRNHFLSIVHRNGYSWAESHEWIADFYIILDGSGTLLLGGEMVESVSIDAPGEWRSPRLSEAKPYEVAKGDLINIPSNVPHQWDLTDDEAVTYVIVKVLEDTKDTK